MLRKATAALGLVLASGLAAAAMTHARWGYFVVPPSGEPVVAAADRIASITHYRLQADGTVEVRDPVQVVANDPSACRVFQVECLEGRLLRAAALLPRDLPPSAESAGAIQSDVNETCGGWPGPRWGVVIGLMRSSGPARVVACRSDDLGHDMHEYREVLFSAAGRQELASYRYEVSGLEFLTMPVLTLLLAAAGALLTSMTYAVCRA